MKLHVVFWRKLKNAYRAFKAPIKDDSWARVITINQLRKLDACEGAIASVKATFGSKIVVTPSNAVVGPKLASAWWARRKLLGDTPNSERCRKMLNAGYDLVTGLMRDAAPHNCHELMREIDDVEDLLGRIIFSVYYNIDRYQPPYDPSND